MRTKVEELIGEACRAKQEARELEEKLAAVSKSNHWSSLPYCSSYY